MSYKKITLLAKKIRRNILDASLKAGLNSSHFGGALSSVEIVATLYQNFIKIKKKKWDIRDRFILSKGHACLVLYSVLYEIGLISKKEFFSFEQDNSILPGHPVYNPSKGIEFSNGSLGMGLSLGIGTAFAAKTKKINSKIYVLMGDGECNEGSVWEAALLAPSLKLDNLCCIIDFNQYQQTGSNKEILDLGNLANKWKSFNWHVQSVDGHDVVGLNNVFKKKTNKPKLIIAKTIKGKGFSFSENNNDWHHKTMTKNIYNLALSELNK